jgi:hypothetical protein
MTKYSVGNNPHARVTRKPDMSVRVAQGRTARAELSSPNKCAGRVYLTDRTALTANNGAEVGSFFFQDPHRPVYWLAVAKDTL